MVPIQASSLGRRTGCSRRYPGGTAYRSIFRTVSRASPNCRAASRSLILSTTTARRTLAYSSTVYTSPVFHKTQLYGNVQWNQSPVGLVLLRPATPLTRRLLVYFDSGAYTYSRRICSSLYWEPARTPTLRPP